MGRGDLVKNKTTGNIEHHAVVVVGEYKDDGLFAPGEAVEPLWIYQDSNIRGEGDLGKGLNVVRHRLVKEVYFAKIYA
ncbi:hypothetical protein, partial [Klebsiella pneumoniae]|uniref:hypothetical protein n=1 Tax=Klebsiella pneumoniae TaxID=573 RepID=UPI00273107D8